MIETNNYEDYPLEIQASQYYIHKSYVNVYYYMYKFLEEWITKNIFRNDKSRIFLASDEYAYRRRFELTDTSKDYETLDFSSLRLPFANYWPQNTGWTPDNRVAAKQAALTYLGIYEGDTKIRAAASIINVPVTFYFDREDDARMAYEILYFNSFNEHYYNTNVPYIRSNTVNEEINQSSNVLKLPSNITISDIKFNPNYKENDWLKKQRVYIIRANFAIRTYTILPPEQPDYTLSLDPSGYLSDGSTYEDGKSYYYIVDDVILNFNNKSTKSYTCDAGYDEVTQSYKGTAKFPDEGESGVTYVDSHCDEDDYGKNLPLSFYIWDEINKKYVSPDTELDAMSIRYNGVYEESYLNITKFDCVSNVTVNSNKIEWEYGRDTVSETSYTELYNTSSVYDKSKAYSKDDLCIKDEDLYICDSPVSAGEEWNESKWTKIDNQVSKIELHLSNSANIINIDDDLKYYNITNLVGNSQYFGYMIFYSKKGGTKKFIVNFVTPKTKEQEQSKVAGLNSIVGITW